jgi:hypothetical protein
MLPQLRIPRRSVVSKAVKDSDLNKEIVHVFLHGVRMCGRQLVLHDKILHPVFICALHFIS